MKKNTTFSIAKQISVLFVIISLIVSILWNTDANAQNNKGKSEQSGKSINNVSAWKSTVQSQKQTSITGTNLQSLIIPKTGSTSKEVKEVNPEGYYLSETSKVSQGYSSESKELVEKRDAQSRTFLNLDGSYTKYKPMVIFIIKMQAGTGFL